MSQCEAKVQCWFVLALSQYEWLEMATGLLTSYLNDLLNE